MICTSVIPCLPSGLAKNNKIMSMSVLFSRNFGHLKVLFFSKMEDKPYTRVDKQDVFSQFFKRTTIT